MYFQGRLRWRSREVKNQGVTQRLREQDLGEEAGSPSGRGGHRRVGDAALGLRRLLYVTRYNRSEPGPAEEMG